MLILSSPQLLLILIKEYNRIDQYLLDLGLLSKLGNALLKSATETLEKV